MWPFSKTEEMPPATLRQRIEKIEDENPIPPASSKKVDVSTYDVEKIYEGLLKRVKMALIDHNFEYEAACRPEFSQRELKSGAVERAMNVVRDAGYEVRLESSWLRISLR